MYLIHLLIYCVWIAAGEPSDGSLACAMCEAKSEYKIQLIVKYLISCLDRSDLQHIISHHIH